MLARGIGLLILLWCSLLAGVGYARRGTPPPVISTEETGRLEMSIVSASEPQEAVQPQAAVRAQPEPPIRIILRSPYEPR